MSASDGPDDDRDESRDQDLENRSAVPRQREDIDEAEPLRDPPTGFGGRQGRIEVTRSWSGITPPPEDCERFERIVPGFTKQILDEVQTEGRHRRRRETTGQWMAFAIASGGLIGAFGLVFAGHDWAGVSLGTVDLVALAALFFGRNRNAETDAPET